MKNVLIFTLTIIAITELNKIKAQVNLVPNWSFEDTVNCPNSLTQIDRAVGWQSFRQSPDYFNSCAPDILFPGVSLSVPSNYWGYQLPKTGDAYVGLETFSKASINSREFLGIQLTQSLNIGEKYFISFFVNRAETTTHSYINIAINKIGVRLLTVGYSSSSWQPIDNYAQVYTDSIIIDTLSWTKISGSFISDSSYRYLSIGNFFNDSLTTLVAFDTTSSTAYYYVDDIRLSTDSNFVNSVQGNSSNNMMNIFPNPTQDWIEIRGNEIKSFALYDILGRLIYTNLKFISPCRLNTSVFLNGIYIIVAETNNQTIKQKIIIK